MLLDLANRQQDSDPSLVVIKVGGSLLEFPGLVDRIEWLLARRRDAHCLLLCGGGRTANTVRQWQQVYGLSDEQAHQLALHAVAFNELLLGSVLPGSTIVESEQDLYTAWERDERPILACEQFLRSREPEHTCPLPHTWDVTSDSIAAWCAEELRAGELILAKSVNLPPDLSVESAAGQGLVDAHFPHVLGTSRVCWSNLRAQSPRLVAWL